MDSSRLVPGPGSSTLAPGPDGAGWIDLNADLGESYGNWRMGDDAAMLGVVTSANIACGFHAGDPLTIRNTVRLAVAQDVVIGAHIAYHDLAGFGRRTIDIEADALEADVLYQLAALDGICRSEGSKVRYVKAHGALYHRMNSDPVQAAAVVSAVRAYDPSLTLLGAPVGQTASAASEGGTTVHGECFADRIYNADGVTLKSRTLPGSVLHDSEAVAAQAMSLARTGRYQSICLHGDTPGAVSHAKAVRETLEHSGFVIRSFL
jgi:5-oxoprolinase (ATP-hydrolysing) subunit A